MGNKERLIQGAALDYLRKHPAIAFAFIQSTGTVRAKGYYMTLGFPGLPDITAMTKQGRYVAIECKTPGNAPTKIQAEFLDLVRECGGIAGCITDISQLTELLREI